LPLAAAFKPQENPAFVQEKAAAQAHARALKAILPAVRK